MKKLFLVTVSIVLAVSACGQKVKKEDLPSSVITKFSFSYPKVEKVKWSKENGNYEAEFEQNEIETSVVYDSLGTTLETEIEITMANLPVAITDYIAKNCNGAKIKVASKITNGKGVVTYEAEVKGVDYVFNKDGIFIEKSGEKKDKKDKD